MPSSSGRAGGQGTPKPRCSACSSRYRERYDRAMPEIEGYAFGRVTVDGRKETRDVIVLPERVEVLLAADAVQRYRAARPAEDRGRAAPDVLTVLLPRRELERRAVEAHELLGRALRRLSARLQGRPARGCRRPLRDRAARGCRFLLPALRRRGLPPRSARLGDDLLLRLQPALRLLSEPRHLVGGTG